MAKQLNINQRQETYNLAVHTAYFGLLKQSKQMLSTIQQEELRFTLEREDKSNTIGTIIHEIVSPMLYLRLECHTDNTYAIHFGIEPVKEQGVISAITTKFLRSLYKLTAKESTTVPIEDCVRTDWFINHPSAMYEYLEERGLKHHSFKQLPYKPATKRKLRSVA